MKKIRDFMEIIKVDMYMIIFTFLGTLIYTVGIVWFLDSNRLFSGGIVGMSQIVTAITDKLDINIPLNPVNFFGMLNFLFNVPLIVLAFTKLNRRYAIYSTFSILLQTVLILWTPLGTFENVSWVADNFIGVAKEGGVWVISDIGKVLASAVVGGAFIGFGAGIAMKFGSSTGGLDIFAQYYSFKSDKSVGGFFLLFNGVIILIAFLTLSPELAIFTLIRQVVSTLSLDNVHTSYNYVSLDVVSKHSEKIAERLLQLTGRGVTKMKTHGAYSNQEITRLNIVCSSYEISDILDEIYMIDPNAFTTSTNVARLYGRFNKRLIGTKH